MNYHPLISIALVTFMMCCSKNNDVHEIELKKLFIETSISLVEQEVEDMEIEAPTPANEEIWRVYDKYKAIKSLRDNYENVGVTENLIPYVDSVLNQYNLIPERDERIIVVIHKYRKKILKNGDTLSVLNLYAHALHGEYAVASYCNSLIYSDGQWPRQMFVSHMNRSVVTMGDTAVLLIQTIGAPGEWNIGLQKIKCTNSRTGRAINPKIKRVANFFLLEYLPKKKGKYLIHGEVTFSHDNYRDQKPVLNEFTVE